MGYSRDPLDGRDDIARGDRSGEALADSREVSSSSVEHAGLQALSDLDDLEIAEGEPDIRGWTVRTADGVHVGEVDDLIIDTLAMKVRYMCVELDGATFELDDKRRVLVPLGTARLDDVNDDVFIASSAAQLLALPAYDDDTFTTGDSRDSHELFGRPWMTGQTASADENRINTLDSRDLYEQDQYDDRNFFGARRRNRDDQSYLRRQEAETRNQSAGDAMRGEIVAPRSIADERLTSSDAKREHVDQNDIPYRARLSADDDLIDDRREVR